MLESPPLLLEELYLDPLPCEHCHFHCAAGLCRRATGLLFLGIWTGIGLQFPLAVICLTLAIAWHLIYNLIFGLAIPLAVLYPGIDLTSIFTFSFGQLSALYLLPFTWPTTSH